MAFHSELLPQEAVDNTAFAVWIGLCRHATESGAETYSSWRAAAKHSSALQVSTASFVRLSLHLDFLHGRLLSSLSWVFLALSRMLLQSLYWKAPLEFPVAAHWNCPPGTQVFAGGGGADTAERALWTCQMTGSIWQSHWVSGNALNI